MVSSEPIILCMNLGQFLPVILNLFTVNITCCFTAQSLIITQSFCASSQLIFALTTAVFHYQHKLTLRSSIFFF